ncbi:hypothetical protein LCGC14_2056540, partial [marine sediment metagenome]
QEPTVSESPDEVVKVDDEPRPDWVDALPGLTGGIYSTSVRSGRFATLPECQRELDRQIKSEADHYINEYLGEQAATLVDIPLSYLKDRVKKAELSGADFEYPRIRSERVVSRNKVNKSITSPKPNVFQAKPINKRARID